MSNTPTEAEFVEAYVKLIGSTVDHARDVYRILVDPKATPEFVAGMVKVCEQFDDSKKGEK